MGMKLENLRALIREIIEETIEEVSTSAAAGPYSSPYAFSRKRLDPLRKKLVDMNGYTAADESGEEGGEMDTKGRRPMKEGRSRYDNFKEDVSATPKQKIGRAVMEMNRQLDEIQRVVEMSSRLKTESQLGSTDLWKRTIRHIAKMENRMVSLANKIRELKN